MAKKLFETCVSTCTGACVWLWKALDSFMSYSSGSVHSLTFFKPICLFTYVCVECAEIGMHPSCGEHVEARGQPSGISPSTTWVLESHSSQA